MSANIRDYEWDLDDIYTQFYQAVRKAGVQLPEDIGSALFATDKQNGHSEKDSELLAEDDPQKFKKEIGRGKQDLVLSMIRKNIAEAEKSGLPLCQDTGMLILFLDIGKDIPLLPSNLEGLLEQAAADAYRDGFFRKSIVSEPVYERTNTGTNLPLVFHYRFVPGNSLRISGMLKGFGSENCSSLDMLNPTAGEDGVSAAVIEAVKRAGGKPCPPIVVGVGIGGSAEVAMLLSKRALLRDLEVRNSDARYAALETRLLQEINKLNIGPGGLGGPLTALGVSVEQTSTHIAGLPVGVSISCWADRKFSLEVYPHEQ
ncbi:MAG: fumarate hydratase [Spirochaetia bacterium]|nr:fumarate hydratase [Spirochaetia bacterium]